MTNADLQYWMTHFIMEVRKMLASFPLNTLHHICCRIMRYLCTNGKVALDFFKDPEFADFRASIDAEMKRQQAAGLTLNANKRSHLPEKKWRYSGENGC